MRRIILVAAVLLSGCGSRSIYEVRLVPKAEGLQRTLTGWVDQEPNKHLPDEELQQLAGLYPERVTPPNELRQTFRGTFANKLPRDLEGWGSYRVVTTPLGSAHWYFERIGGAADLDGETFDRRAAVDRLVDLIIGWFDEQMKDSPHRESVHRFLQQDFRQDVRNISALSLALWSAEFHDAEPADREGFIEEPAAGIAAYLVEHDYLLEDEPIIPIFDVAELQPEQTLSILRRLLARKAKLPADAADDAFPFLHDPEKIETSIVHYLRKTPEYGRKLRAWEARPEKMPDDEPPEPGTVLGDLAGRAITWHGVIDELRLSLELPCRPHLTNGEFDDSTNVVRWTIEVPGPHDVPAFAHATWVVPDEKFQLAHFGKSAVAAGELAAVATLYATLSPARQAEFAAHLKSLEPGDAIKGRVQDFSFADPVDHATRAAGERLKEIIADEL